MKLIVGLGNPGKEYEKTRHNAGFMMLDHYAKIKNLSSVKDFKNGLYYEYNNNGEKILLLKPQSYMNLSGEAVQEAMKFFRIDIKDLIVIYDDMDLPVGKVRLREKGSAGGQNGMKNIIQHVYTQEFNRIRVGIGKDPKIPTVDYVLGKIRKEDLEAFDQALEVAKDAVLYAIDHSFADTMNRYNKK